MQNPRVSKVILVAVGVIITALYLRWRVSNIVVEQGALHSPPPIPALAPLTQPSPSIIKPSSVGYDKKKDFVNFTEKVLAELPTRENLKDLKEEETHQMPTQILKKITPLVTINRMVGQDPDLKTLASDFYKKCANKSDLLVSVRARCLAHLKKISSEKREPLDLSVYPEAVRRLSDFIP